MMKHKYAAQLYTVREFCLNEKDTLDTFDRIKAIGFDGVEIEGLWGVIKPETAAAHLRDIGLDVCATRSPQGRVERLTDEVIDEALVYGTKNCGVGTMVSLYSRSQDGTQQYIRLIAPLIEKICASGLTPSYEVHPHDFLRLPPNMVHDFDTLIERFGKDELHFTLDTFHLVRSGVDVSECVDRVAGRADTIRFRDQKIVKGTRSVNHPNRNPCEVGGGVLDFASFMPAIDRAGIEWITIGEELAARDPFDCLKMGLDFSKKL